MKKLILLILIMTVVSLVSCSAVKESLKEPVDPNDSNDYTFVVKEGDTWGDVAGKLSEQKLVANSLIVKDYVEENDLSNRLQPGTYTVKKSMSLSEIVAILTKPTIEKEAVTVTIPEGLENKAIATILEESGAIKSADRFLELLANEDFDYDFLNGADKKTYLEGYLFPDTYEFYKYTDEKEVIDRLLARFDEIYNDELRARAKELGFSDNEVITLASIIQREAKASNEFPIVSSVFHNRIKQDMKLQACSTVQYVIEERKDVLTNDDIAIDSPYNTYLYTGLPPAPISSVGEVAIKAALYPEDTEYLFFVVQNKGDGSHYFAKTYEEHLENINKSDQNLEESE